MADQIPIPLVAANFTPGRVLPTRTYPVRRVDLVRYAGASGDFNPIHWSDRVATTMGLPGVIAHGMYTMALASRALTEWIGDPRALREFGVRFTKPVVVPDDDHGVEVEVSASVREYLADGCVRLDLAVLSGEVKVLGQARAIIQLRSESAALV